GQELLRRARAALRGGRPREAQELAAAAMAADADTAGVTAKARALADEIAALLADAEGRLKEAAAAAAERRWVTAAFELDERRARAREEVVRATERYAAALAGPEAEREAALRALLAECRDHEGAR